MSHSDFDYTPSGPKRKLEGAIRSIAKAQAHANGHVNIHFRADPRDRKLVDASSVDKHGMSFAQFVKKEWVELLDRRKMRPRRPQVGFMSTRDRYFAQFPEGDSEIVLTILALSEGMEPGAMLTIDKIFDNGVDMPQESRKMSEYQAVGRIMSKLKWTRVQVMKDGKRIWAYRKPRNMILPPPEER